METEMHPLVSFWQDAYGLYSRPLPGGLEFSLPGFPDPLLSPRFSLGCREAFLRSNPEISYFNEISDRELANPAGFQVEREFLLGTKRPTPFVLPPPFSSEETSLKEATARPVYWQLLEQAFPGDAGFLRGLLPFLADLNSFSVIFLRAHGGILGAITVGVAGRVALVMNAAVREPFRGRGLSRLLSGAAGDFSRRTGAEKAFFWTEHGFLGPYAEEVSWYRVWRRAAIRASAES